MSARLGGYDPDLLVPVKSAARGRAFGWVATIAFLLIAPGR
jgi:hypothetical protein